jgi:ankyrin repeat protein
MPLTRLLLVLVHVAGTERSRCRLQQCLQSSLPQSLRLLTDTSKAAWWFSSSTAIRFQYTSLHEVEHFTAYCTETTAAILDSLAQQQQQLTAVINRTNSSGKTALRRTVVKQCARKRVCHGCMRILLAAGADITADEWEPDILAEVIRETTMYDDSFQRAELTVQALVQRGLDVEQQDALGRTLLQHRAHSIWEDCSSTADIASAAAAMRALLAGGANATAADSEGNTALHILANSMVYEYSGFRSADHLWCCRSERAIRAVYDSAGAACLAARNSEGHTPLHIAVEWPGHVQLLITLGADVHAVNVCGETPLHVAAACGELSVQLLLEAGANLHAATATGFQPLHYAAGKCIWQLCRVLLDRGADVNATSSTGISVTRYALQYCESDKDRWLEPVLKCVQLLVEAGADVQEYSEQWGTLLHSSATIKCAAVTQHLLDKLLPAQADVPDKVDVHGRTALYCAAACDNAAVVKLLLAAGASAQLGPNPLRACVCSPSSDAASGLPVFSMLLDAGASCMQLDSSG